MGSSRNASALGRPLPSHQRGPRTRLSKAGFRSWLAFGLVASSGSLLGCQRLSQMRECGRFISSVNSSLGEITAESAEKSPEGSNPRAPKLSLRKVEASYRQLARDLGKLDLDDRELKAQVGGYQSLLNRAARAVSALARAQNEKNEAKIGEATQSLAQIKSAALATSAQLNRICQQRY